LPPKKRSAALSNGSGRRARRYTIANASAWNAGRNAKDTMPSAISRTVSRPDVHIETTQPQTNRT
jgi:hypothetical protein